MSRGDDFQYRQVSNGCQSVCRQGQSGGPGPGAFHRDLLKAVFDELTDARAAVDMRNELSRKFGSSIAAWT